MSATNVNVALRSVQFIRAAVKQLHGSSVPMPDVADARGLRRNALDTLEEVAKQLEQYAGAFVTETETTV